MTEDEDQTRDQEEGDRPSAAAGEAAISGGEETASTAADETSTPAEEETADTTEGETAAAGGEEPPQQEAEPAFRDYSGTHVLVSVVVSILVTALLLWWASNFAVFFERLFRIGPTVEGGGVGADWVAGNTVASLDFLVALVHAADVILGLFILFLVFVHWAAFRRLAGRMRQPGEAEERAVAADGSGAEGGDDR